MLQIICSLPDVKVGEGHACTYQKRNVEGSCYLWKSHRWMANHDTLLEATCKKCPGGPDHYVHAKVEGRESKPSGAYSVSLVRCILSETQALDSLSAHTGLRRNT